MSNGANWVLYKRRVVIALGSKPPLIRHLEGRAPQPSPPTPIPAKSGEKEQKDYQKLVAEFSTKMDEWEARDFAVMQQIIASIPDTIFIRIQNHDTAAGMWDALKKDFEGRTQAVKNELRNRFAMAKCGNNENVHEHVDRMRYMFEELSGMGVAIPDGEYAALLVKSMPKSFSHYFAAISGAAEVSGNRLTPSMVMSHAIREYDRRQIENAPKRGGASTGNAALYSFAPDSGCSGRRGRRNGKNDEKRTCYNCGEAGHLKRNCRKPKKEGGNAKASGSGGASQSASSGGSQPPQASASIAEVPDTTPPPKDSFTSYTLSPDNQAVLSDLDHVPEKVRPIAFT